jgi:ABC-type transport system involved in multi-copper enzyme maturation permease subunit
MLDLFRADLKRVVRDRLFLIVCIVAAVLAATTPLLYWGLGLFEGALEEMGMFLKLSGRGMFFDALLPGGNVGLILPVFLVILLCKDFTWGTVRNKIVCGKTRGQIFLSLFLTSATVTVSVMLAQAVLSSVIGSIIFGFQSTPFTAADVGYLALSVLFEILLYVMISALVSFFTVVSPNMGVGIVLYVAVNLVFTIIGSITSVAYAFTKEPHILVQILNDANLFTSRVIGGGTSYSWKEVLYVLVPALLGGVGFGAWGYFAFRKKDLK